MKFQEPKSRNVSIYATVVTKEGDRDCESSPTPRVRDEFYEGMVYLREFARVEKT